MSVPGGWPRRLTAGNWIKDALVCWALAALRARHVPQPRPMAEEKRPSAARCWSVRAERGPGVMPTAMAWCFIPHACPSHRWVCDAHAVGYTGRAAYCVARPARCLPWTTCPARALVQNRLRAPASPQRRRGLDWTSARGCLRALSCIPAPAGRLREGLSKSLAPRALPPARTPWLFACGRCARLRSASSPAFQEAEAWALPASMSFTCRRHCLKLQPRSQPPHMRRLATIMFVSTTVGYGRCQRRTSA